MASTVKGKCFYFGDAWTRNEEMAREQGVIREGVERTERRPVGPKGTQLHRDAAIGMDGVDVHRRGERVTTLAENPVIRNGRATGSIETYVQHESGGTYRQVWEKVGEGKHVLAEYKRVRSF